MATQTRAKTSKCWLCFPLEESQEGCNERPGGQTRSGTFAQKEEKEGYRFFKQTTESKTKGTDEDKN